MNTIIPINWDQLSLVVGDDSDPGDDEMKALFRMFVGDAGNRLRALISGEQSLHAADIAKEAHKIRGAASSFGFNGVAGLLTTVETQIDSLGKERIDQLLKEALASFERSVSEVHQRHPELAA